MKFLFAAILLLLSVFSFAQQKQYYCSPCGCTKDHITFDAPGKCPACNMDLLEIGQYTNSNPVPSPDGQWLAYLSTKDQNKDIYILNLETKNTLRLTENELEDEHLAWSPDGKKIAYTCYTDEYPEVFVVNMDGTERARLTYQAGFDGLPSWSPDGSMLAFISRRTGKSAIFTMKNDGTNVQMVTDENVFYFAPEWTADGKSLIYTSRKDNQSPWELIQVSLLGQREQIVTRPIFNATVSPDGKKILYNKSTKETGVEVFVMNLDGTSETALTSTPNANNNQPNWSPDGQAIYFTSNRTGLPEVYKLDLRTKKEQQLTFQK